MPERSRRTHMLSIPMTVLARRVAIQPIFSQSPSSPFFRIPPALSSPSSSVGGRSNPSLIRSLMTGQRYEIDIAVRQDTHGSRKSLISKALAFALACLLSLKKLSPTNRRLPASIILFSVFLPSDSNVSSNGTHQDLYKMICDAAEPHVPAS